MAKSDNSADVTTDPMQFARAVMGAAPLGPQSRHFWQAQDRILDEAQKFSTAWFKRRHEAAQSALKVTEAMATQGASNPAVAIQALTEWQTHSMERMAQDAKDCMEMMGRCTGLAVSNEVEAVEETVAATRKTTKQSKSDPV